MPLPRRGRKVLPLAIIPVDLPLYVKSSDVVYEVKRGGLCKAPCGTPYESVTLSGTLYKSGRP